MSRLEKVVNKMKEGRPRKEKTKIISKSANQQISV
jgi:hypothetical protein